MEKSIKNKEFSFSFNLFNTDLEHKTHIAEIYEYITTDEELKQQTIEVRNTFGTEEYNKLKLQLPYTLYSGIFIKRNKKDLKKMSGFIHLDFDKLENVEEVKSEIEKLPFTLMTNISPSGVGLKVVIDTKIKTVEDYKNYFIALEEFFKTEFNLQIDKACKDVSRACLINYDATAYLNLESEILDNDFLTKWLPNKIKSNEEDKPIEKVKISDEQKQRIKDRVLTDVHSKIEEVADGEKHNVLLSQSNRLGYYVFYNIIDNQTAYDELLSAISKRKIEDIEKAKKTIVDGLTYGMQNPPTAEELGITKKMIFWSIYVDDKERAHLLISYSKTYRFLNHHGFWLYRKDDTYLFVRVTDNIITKVNKYEIIQFMLDFVHKQPWRLHEQITRDDLEELFRKKINVLFSDKQLHTFNPLYPRFVRDTKATSYYYFKNGILEVTANGYQLKPYKEMKGHIWDSQILNRDFIDLKLSFDEVEKRSEFAQFIKGISGNIEVDNQQRLDSMLSILGYLLSSYKDPKLSRAVILCDEKISDVPSGGTGKGITLKAINYFKNVAVIDGKNVNFGSQFVYQQVELDTNVVIFEDVQKKFDFEKLFSVITEGFGVEKKNKDKFFIPYEEAPKVVITTNYMVEGQGNSHERRRIEYEFSQHYNKFNTPYDEFKHNLYDDWDDEQWQLFNLFMTYCVQFFLKNGLIAPPNINIGMRKLIQKTNEDFAYFMKNTIKDLLNNEVEKRFIYNNFEAKHPEYKKFMWFTPRHFNKWLRICGDSYGYKVVERVSNNKQLIRFEEINQ